ncbi:flavin reductase family protein [Nitrospirillum sp. BR 11163]|uniref:flavin reductase family protein n=1 Tax=Nitrospirillum sp. BR 11163 TaxID=3104323 RepID=UPI003A4C7DF5
MMSNGRCSMIDSATFRTVLGHYPTGVCVITSTEPDGRPVGMSVGSFTSVSLDPPLVAFFPDRRSSTWQRIRNAEPFLR